MQPSHGLNFEPKVWQDHIEAYFDLLLVWGAFAFNPDDDGRLQKPKSGETLHFPFYTTIGPAQDLSEDEILVPESLSDDSFTATVKEVGKALAFSDTQFVKTGDTQEGLENEGERQIARVMAEKVDLDLRTEIYNTDNYEIGFDPRTSGPDKDVTTKTLNIKNMYVAKQRAFGDRGNDAVVCFVHSKQMVNLITDPNSGFLKADANDPLSFVQGYQGRAFGGMAMVEVDSVPLSGTEYHIATFHKMFSYGFIKKKEMKIEGDRDILARKNLVASTQWYAVKSFHKKISPLDMKAGAIITKSS